MLETTARATVDYCRISFDKRGAAEGVATQHLENEISAEELDLTIARSYVDNDKSAYSGVERPQYAQLLKDMKAGTVGVIIIRHADRLHRSVDEVSAFIKVARAHKVKLYSGMRGSFYNLEKAAGRKDLINDTVDAEYESEHRGERVSDARKRQARNGVYGGGIRPYGWGVDTGRVRSVCVNPQAPVSERIYEDRPVLDMTQHRPNEVAEIRRWAKDLLTGVSIRHILADLAARKVPTVAQTDGLTRHRNGKEVKHNGWSSSTIHYVLTNPRVAGHTVHQGKIIKRNAYPAIIPEDQRQALIDLLSDPSRRTMRGNTPKWLGSLIYECGICNNGAVMSVRYIHERPAYTCRDKNHIVHWVERTDAYITSTIVERLSHDDVVDLLPKEEEQTEGLTELREELVMLDANRRKIAARNALGQMDDEEWESAREVIERRTAEIWEKLRGSAAESPLEPFVSSSDVRRTWKEMHLGRQREVLKLLMRVKLLPIGRGRRQVDIRDYIVITPAMPDAPTTQASPIAA
ncbi:recombinase family protein [Streptosporangium sp. NPDC020145]|uniref:Recombinase family protein n=1 Tax=Streptosporangium jomthongense TaxID=1193683 RepID=A0ABV8F9N0_9ACTN